jgi:type VI secretion system secreted protein Hcp
MSRGCPAEARDVQPTLGHCCARKDDIMAIGAYLWFLNYDGTFLDSESQVDLSSQLKPPEITFPPNDNIFEIEGYAFDVAQALNIGSQSTGAGAGKITFNPFSITRKSDRASPVLFQMACSGTAFESVVLVLTRSSGGNATALAFERFTFKLVAVKSIAWAYDAETPKEIVTFEYGGLVIDYWMQKPDGSSGSRILGGWNRVKNISDHDPASALA